jgi:hypothetical protein
MGLCRDESCRCERHVHPLELPRRIEGCRRACRSSHNLPEILGDCAGDTTEIICPQPDELVADVRQPLFDRKDPSQLPSGEVKEGHGHSDPEVALLQFFPPLSVHYEHIREPSSAIDATASLATLAAVFPEGFLPFRICNHGKDESEGWRWLEVRRGGSLPRVRVHVACWCGFHGCRSQFFPLYIPVRGSGVKHHAREVSFAEVSLSTSCHGIVDVSLSRTAVTQHKGGVVGRCIRCHTTIASHVLHTHHVATVLKAYVNADDGLQFSPESGGGGGPGQPPRSAKRVP